MRQTLTDDFWGLHKNINCAFPLRNLQTSQANNSRIHRITNVKFSGYCFYINTNIWGDFQISISVPLSSRLLLGFTRLPISSDWSFSIPTENDVFRGYIERDQWHEMG